MNVLHRYCSWILSFEFTLQMEISHYWETLLTWAQKNVSINTVFEKIATCAWNSFFYLYIYIFAKTVIIYKRLRTEKLHSYLYSMNCFYHIKWNNRLYNNYLLSYFGELINNSSLFTHVRRSYIVGYIHYDDPWRWHLSEHNILCSLWSLKWYRYCPFEELVEPWHTCNDTFYEHMHTINSEVDKIAVVVERPYPIKTVHRVTIVILYTAYIIL